MVRGSLDEDALAIRNVVGVVRETGSTTLSQNVRVVGAVSTGV